MKFAPATIAPVVNPNIKRKPNPNPNPMTHDPRIPVYTGKKKRLSYLVGNLVATNWPIEKALHAIGYNQIPTK